MDAIYYIGISALIYIVFILWYGGRTKPLSKEEIDEFFAKLTSLNQADEHSLEMARKLREVAENDDGKDFVMVNLMKFKNTEKDSEAMIAHRKYSQAIMPLLLRYGSIPMFLGEVKGRFLFDDESENWDQVGMVRYRSRRDFLRFAIAVGKKDLDEYKWKSMEKTHVFPVKPVISVGFVRTLFLLLLTIIFFIII